MTVRSRVVVGALLAAGTMGGCTDSDGGTTDPTAADPSSPPPILDGRTLLGPPASQWTVRPHDIEPAATLLTNPETQQPAVHLTNDAVVVSVRAGVTRVLAGIDPADGTVIWRQVDEYDGQCWTVAAGAAVACTDLEQQELRLLDPATGAVEGTFVAAAYAVVDAGAAMFVLSDGSQSPDDDSVRVSKLSTDDLEELWTSVGADPGTGRGGGDDQFTTDVHVQGDRVSARSGRLLWTFDAATGEIIAPDAVPDDVEQHGDYRFVTDFRHPTPRVSVTDADGKAVLVGLTYPWEASDLISETVIDDRAGFRDRLYDLTTGDVVWARPRLFGLDPETGVGRAWSWSPDHRQVLATGAGVAAGTTVLDADTGTTMWQVDEELHPDGTSSAEAAVVVLGGSGRNVTVVDRATGDLAWTRDLSAINDYSKPDYSIELNRFAMTETTVIAYNDWAVTAFTDFGP